MASNNDGRARATNTFILAVGLLTAALALAPAASAVGYLVNVETGVINAQYGTNAFGGSGDTLDVGYQNYQCSDEDDVVDVGIQNREGDGDCGFHDPTTGESTCEAEQGDDGRLVIGSDVFGFEEVIILPVPGTDGIDFAAFLITTSGERAPHCSDDGDTVDIGVDNDEGGYGDHATRERCWSRTDKDHANEGTPDYKADPAGRDEADAVDVGVLNRECGDDRDANDVGVANCELDDQSDGIDVGAFNLEWYDDDDTFDLSVFNWETFDTPDGNGINVGPPILFQETCWSSLGDPLGDPCERLFGQDCKLPRCHVDPTTGEVFCTLFQ